MTVLYTVHYQLEGSDKSEQSFFVASSDATSIASVISTANGILKPGSTILGLTVGPFVTVL